MAPPSGRRRYCIGQTSRPRPGEPHVPVETTTPHVRRGSAHRSSPSPFRERQRCHLPGRRSARSGQQQVDTTGLREEGDAPAWDMDADDRRYAQMCRFPTWLRDDGIPMEHRYSITPIPAPVAARRSAERVWSWRKHGGRVRTIRTGPDRQHPGSHRSRHWPHTAHAPPRPAA